MPNQTESPLQIGGGLNCDGFKIGQSNKLDLEGTFTVMYLYAFPAQRIWSLVFSALDVAPNDEVNVFLEGPSGHKTQVSNTAFPKEPNNPHINASIIAYSFIEAGTHRFSFEVNGTSQDAEVLFLAVLREWPEFDEEEINLVRNSKGLYSSKASVSVKCGTCSTVYDFEEKLLAEEVITKGYMSFPEEGFLSCPKCQNRIELRDIQGQLRASLKAGITSKV